jgi:hypothetical protein
MNINKYPPNVQKYLSELVKRDVLNEEDPTDIAFINYLYTHKYDEDYVESMDHDRTDGMS